MSKISSIMMAMGIKKPATAKVAAKAAAVVSKPAVKAEAKAADAMEAQGRAMVKKYQKPEIEVIKIKNENMRATSGEFNPGGNTGGGPGGEQPMEAPDGGWAVQSSIWD